MKTGSTNPKQRPRGRVMQQGNGGGKKNIPLRNQTFDSNGPDIRIRGNAHQVHEKYLALARDAAAQGDRVAAENYYQHAEHYHRIINTYAPPAMRPARSEGQSDTHQYEEDASEMSRGPEINHSGDMSHSVISHESQSDDGAISVEVSGPAAVSAMTVTTDLNQDLEMVLQERTVAAPKASKIVTSSSPKETLDVTKKMMAETDDVPTFDSLESELEAELMNASKRPRGRPVGSTNRTLRAPRAQKKAETEGQDSDGSPNSEQSTLF